MLEEGSEASRPRRGVFSTLLFVLRHPLQFFGERPFPTSASPLTFTVAVQGLAFAGVQLWQENEGLAASDVATKVVASGLAGMVYAVPLLYLSALFTHPAVYALGGRAGFKTTVNALAFASAPAVAALLPYGALVGLPCTLAFGAIAVGRAQGMGMPRAALAYGLGLSVSVLLASGLRTFVVEAFKVPTGGMIPTIHVGDHLFASKSAYGLFDKRPPRRGDVIVFESTRGEGGEAATYVYRVIGLPGDVIEVDDGWPTINGARAPGCKVGRMTLPGGLAEGTLHVEFLDGAPHLAFYETDHYARKEGPFVVGDGQVFVMGDNRHNAFDSRAWSGLRGGGVPFDDIRGRATIVWLPLYRLGLSLGGAVLDDRAAPELREGVARCLARPQ